MAIVKTIKASNGATVHIDDSCCTGLSPEELRRRCAEIDRAIWQININYALRQAEAAGRGGEKEASR